MGGIRIFVDLDEHLQPTKPLLEILRKFCGERDTPQFKRPLPPTEHMWPLAQCERLRGTPVAAILTKLREECRQRVRHSQRALDLWFAADISRTGADGASGFQVQARAEEYAEYAAPPPCFEDTLWDVPYTARNRDHKPPPVHLHEQVGVLLNQLPPLLKP